MPPPVPLLEFSRRLLVSVDLRGGRVRVAGDLDRECAHHLLDGLGALALTGHRTWTVDVADVGFCDASGLRALAGAEALARSGGARVRLLHPRPLLARLLDLVGTEGVLAVPAARTGTPEGPVERRSPPP